MLCAFLEAQYGLCPDVLARAETGVGSETWFITCGTEKYVLKCPEENEMNRPEAEPALCAFLCEKGIPASRFVQNRQEEYLSRDANGRVYHLQHFVEGESFAQNTAPDWFMPAAARMLGFIHTALRAYPGLPVGIGADFFRFMTPDNAAVSYKHSLYMAEEMGETEISEALRYRLRQMEHFPVFRFDPDRLTCTGSHGDFGAHQILCKNGEIRAVIDWTTACVYPAVWEIVRSYVYASPRSEAGGIDAAEFIRYIEVYLKAAPLTAADIRAMIPLYYYQIAVCDYYGQYFASSAANRGIFLQQAQFSTKLMRWFEKHGEELTEELTDYFILGRKVK